MYKIMTPGPTQVRENVRRARMEAATNPDIDMDFYDFYKNTCGEIADLIHTNNPVYILGGEGILGLEAACASLTESEDRVLVIDNGIFGEGFADFVKLYGGIPVSFKGDRKNAIDIRCLENFLERDHDFKYATVVHCDTPSGVLNDVGSICPLLHKYGILTVVDTVSAMFGETLKVDDWNIDIALGGSQKALSAPPGLTLLSVSADAERAMRARKTPIASYYANLLIWENYYKDKWFPYTPPVSDIIGLRAALDNVIEDTDILSRHRRIAEAVRKAVKKAGLKLYLEGGYSNTVTVIEVPDLVASEDILDRMKNVHGIMIAGCFGELAGKVLRIGHMGENANILDMSETLEALDESLNHFGVHLKCRMSEIFNESV